MVLCTENGKHEHYGLFRFWASGVGFMVWLMAKMLGRQVPLNSLFSSL